ncbi:MAG TPA: UDP-N-acetylmuramoyl-L-alanine--D-glutamate ligase [Burkholderiales bacterium]|nr:UDP-N-acetylmuramoyl-L-alanine--D-glutamate ligase [Burkholderiales bacterium]
MNWYGQHILILGLGSSGWAAARWLGRRGAVLRVADNAAEPPNLVPLRELFPAVPVTLGDWNEADFFWADRIIVSPGVPISHPLLQAALSRGIAVWSDVELFAQALPHHAQVIAITGSNGKSTVTSMVHAICEAAGKKSLMAGNIGLPVLDALEDYPETEIYVLELSSFQLEATYTLNPAAATVLNISEDHLDRHADLAAYAAIKARIFTGDSVQVLNRDDRWSAAMAQTGHTVLTFGLDSSANEHEFGVRDGQLCRGDKPLMALDALPVPGMHNVANALAAWALCYATGLPDTAAATALRQFQGLPHRVEWVARIGEVDFYDDSKGTNVGATEAALKGLNRPVVLIAGGEGKGQDFSPLAEAVMRSARAVVQIGRDGPRIAEALEATGVPVLRAESMEQAVLRAYSLTLPGDAVLLSPACASFDMFRNYAHRAEAFVAAVAQLSREMP